MGISPIQAQAIALEEMGFAPPEGDIQGKFTIASIHLRDLFPQTWNFFTAFWMWYFGPTKRNTKNPHWKMLGLVLSL